MKRQRMLIPSAFVGILIVVIAVLVARQSQLLAAHRLAPISRGTPGAPMPTVHATAPSMPVHAYLMVDRLTPALSDICRTHTASSYTPTLIADATVDRLLPSHWLTRDGSREVADPFAIVTPLAFSQLHLLRDGRNGPTSEFIMPGGQVGQDQIIVDGYPQLLPDQRYLLIFEYVTYPQVQDLSNKLLYVSLAFRITAQNMVIAQEGEVVQGVVIQPEQTIPLAEIVARIKANCP